MNKYLDNELKKWNLILAQDGFIDKEFIRDNNNLGLSRDSALEWSYDKLKALSGYMRQRTHYLHHGTFKSSLHKLIWAYHCHGYSFNKMSKRLKQYMPSILPQTLKSGVVDAPQIRLGYTRHKQISFSRHYLYSITQELKLQMRQFFKTQNSYDHAYSQSRYNPVYKRTVKRHVDSIEGLLNSLDSKLAPTEIQRLEMKKLLNKLKST